MKVKADPKEFVRLVLDVDPFDYQDKVLSSLAQNPKVGWRSGHGVGKTATAAWATLWYLTTRKQSKVITTASSWRQVSKQLWPEIHKWGRRADWEAIGTHFDDWEWLTLMIKNKEYEEWFATGEASDDPEKLEGFHAPYLFFVFDESKAIPANTWDALEGALTQEGAKQFAISTPPMDKAGAFFEVFSRKRIGYELHHTSCYDSPIVSRAWIEGRKKEWGGNSPLFKARVLGEFVETGQDSLIPLSRIEEAVERNMNATGKKELGVDVARFGEDKTVIILKHGPKVIWIKKSEKEDTMKTTGRVKKAITEANPAIVKIDVIGVGAGVVDRLLEQDEEVIGFNSAEKPRTDEGKERFINRRAEVWWGLRERFMNGDIDIPDDEELVSQLANIKFKYTSAGKIQIEAKEEMKKRGLKSPDVADALAIAFAHEEVPDPEIEFY